MSEAPARPDESTRVVTLIAYGLFLVALANGITAVIGVVLAYVKRTEARGTLWEGHLRNLIVVFWVGAILFAVFLGLVLPGAATLAWSLVETNGNPPPGLVGGLLAAMPFLWLAGLLFLVWYLYRVVGGFIRALDGKPY